MSASMLKFLAMVSMLIDHIGLLFFPNHIILRMVGRLAFPTFCFFIAEGCSKTRSRPKYLLRLFLFAVVSEVPYRLAIHGSFSLFANGTIPLENIGFTLFFGACSIVLWEYLLAVSPWIAPLGALAGCAMAELFYADYGAYGVMTILCFYLLRRQTMEKFIVFGLLTGLWVWMGFIPNIQLFATLAVIPLIFYNGSLGLRLKYLFYLFYPLHLLILWLLLPLAQTG